MCFAMRARHMRTDFFAVVKGKNVIVPTLTRQNAMRAGLPLEGPPDAVERTQHSTCLCRCPSFKRQTDCALPREAARHCQFDRR